MFKKVLFTMLLPLACFAGIDGPYNVQGFDPTTQQVYGGSAVITEVPGEDNVFRIEWNYGNRGTATGVGIKRNDILSVAFVLTTCAPEMEPITKIGVTSYKIDDNCKELKGKSVFLCDPCREGVEILYKIH